MSEDQPSKESIDALKISFAEVEEEREDDGFSYDVSDALEKLNFCGEYSGLDQHQRGWIVCSAIYAAECGLDISDTHPYSQGGERLFEDECFPSWVLGA